MLSSRVFNEFSVHMVCRQMNHYHPSVSLRCSCSHGLLHTIGVIIHKFDELLSQKGGPLIFHACRRVRTRQGRNILDNHLSVDLRHGTGGIEGKPSIRTRGTILMLIWLKRQDARGGGKGEC